MIIVEQYPSNNKVIGLCFSNNKEINISVITRCDRVITLIINNYSFDITPLHFSYVIDIKPLLRCNYLYITAILHCSYPFITPYYLVII